MPYKDPEKKRLYDLAWQRAHAGAHPEIISARNRASHARHRAERNARKHELYQLNLEENRLKARVYHAAHKAQRSAADHRWRQKNPAYAHAYRLEHPEVFIASNHKRRARKLQAPLNDLTSAQWREIKEHYGHRCVYCGRKMTRLAMDHIIPLAKGGSHTASNVVPACKSCNSRKHTGPPPVPVQPVLLTLAPARKTRKKSDGDTLVQSQGFVDDDACAPPTSPSPPSPTPAPTPTPTPAPTPAPTSPSPPAPTPTPTPPPTPSPTPTSPTTAPPTSTPSGEQDALLPKSATTCEGHPRGPTLAGLDAPACGAGWLLPPAGPATGSDSRCVPWDSSRTGGADAD